MTPTDRPHDKSKPSGKRKVLVFYHYYYPDDVVSAQHFAGLCEGLASRDWEVEVSPSNRGCRDESLKLPLQEEIHGVSVRRIWRPTFKQASGMGRLLNALWMIGGWSLSAIRHRRRPPDALIVGTDPVLSVLCVPIWSIFRKSTRLCHWCFDLHPEAGIADGMIDPRSSWIRFLRRILGYCYRSFDLIVDIGSCMRDRIDRYEVSCEQTTITPWALEEPSEPCAVDNEERRQVFGEVSLALMYSGNFGRAHSYEPIIELARRLPEEIKIVFSVRGNSSHEVQEAVRSEDRNLSLTDFAPQERLLNRLSCADVHIVSLRGKWTGTVVPSKFFGALAVGRPVLFVGSEESAIARWIREYRVGWVLSDNNLDSVILELVRFGEDKEAREEMFARCHRVYREHFSYDSCIAKWDRALASLLGSERSQSE